MKMPANIEKILNNLGRHFAISNHNPLIVISIHSQELYLIRDKKVIKTYSISSAKNGTGNLAGSYQTPLGLHFISNKIGDRAKIGSIFKARINTHKLATIHSVADERNNVDNITTRILWLSGLEDGINKGGDVDSHDRYIYIHGTDEEGRLGKAVSHGCIRMSNQNIIELFNHVTVGTHVLIDD